MVWVVAEDFPGEQDSVSRQKSSGDCVLASLNEVSAVSYDGSSSSSDLNNNLVINFDTRWRRYKMFFFNVKLPNEIEIHLPFSFYPPKFGCCPPFGEGKCRQRHKNDNN